MFGRKPRLPRALDTHDEAFETLSPRSAQRPGLSLKARAVALLSRREHSRLELERKLAPHAESTEQLARVLDELTQAGWQSDLRFTQSWVHRKAPSQGSARVLRDLKLQGIPQETLSNVQSELKKTEYERACAVWSRKFPKTEGQLSAAEYARQARFLASRGFSSDIIRRVLKHSGDEEL
jgi:regulatory protein